MKVKALWEMSSDPNGTDLIHKFKVPSSSNSKQTDQQKQTGSSTEICT